MDPMSMLLQQQRQEQRLQEQQQLESANPPAYDRLGDYERKAQDQPTAAAEPVASGPINPLVYNWQPSMLPMMTLDQEAAFERIVRDQQIDRLNRLLIKVKTS